MIIISVLGFYFGIEIYSVLLWSFYHIHSIGRIFKNHLLIAWISLSSFLEAFSSKAHSGCYKAENSVALKTLWLLMLGFYLTSEDPLPCVTQDTEMYTLKFLTWRTLKLTDKPYTVLNTITIKP